ncbi:MAG TPA: amidohydrolase family protein, partial [Candidatus Eisenbacteria bacterium]|nr:amidohydrolase family protein [Candidatus Eisenbacteria bacterium]
RDNIGRDTPVESREMADIEARLRHMDQIGTDVQVLYPTLFLRPVTDNPRIELALCRSYNRWLADIWSKSNDRLRWAVQLPLLSLDKAIDELRWARGNGACAVFMRGLETRHVLHDPYFYPLYEEATRLNVPIGIHSGIGNFGVNEALGGEPFRVAKLMVIGAFHSLILNGILERFPRLRVGAIEVASQWVPYLVHDLNLRLPKLAGKQADPEIMRNGRLFVACQTDDDLSYVLRYAGEDSLMIGSDYGHADNASELLALKRLKEKGEIEARVVDKILCANPARFYGLEGWD